MAKYTDVQHGFTGVPEDHLGPVEEGILVVDRYAAYSAMAQVKGGRLRGLAVTSARRVPASVAHQLDTLKLPGIGKIAETQRAYVDGGVAARLGDGAGVCHGHAMRVRQIDSYVQCQLSS